MNIVNDICSVFDCYFFLLFGLFVVLFVGKVLKKLFWIVFGMYWVLCVSGIYLFG